LTIRGAFPPDAIMRDDERLVYSRGGGLGVDQWAAN
jgi:hypothetical protein